MCAKNREPLVKRALFLFSVSFFSFAFGIAVNHLKIYPFPVIQEAGTALNALSIAASPPSVDGLFTYRVRTTEPMAISHAEVIDSSFILLSAGPAALKPLYPEGAMAWIVDRKGEVVHHWKSCSDVWSNLSKVTTVPGVSGKISPAGLHLFPNGDLLATFHGHNTFPFAIGIARFDKNSNLLWKQEVFAHHSFSVAEDGKIYVPSLEVVDSPIQIAKTDSLIESNSGKIYRDLILVLSDSGEVLDRFSVLDALFESGLHGNLLRLNASTLTADDPTHLNDVQVIRQSEAACLPGIAEGDLLVSMRNINTVGILDSRTRRFKWVSSGTLVGQHSPRVYKKGIIAVDNLGGDRQLGGTQLVHVNHATGIPETLFPREGIAMPDLCRTANSGHLELHQNGRLALFSVSHEGAIWEVDLETGKVEWEYIYAEPDGDRNRQMIGPSKYVYDLSFLSSK